MEPSSPKPNNHKLPHEILWTIFDNYAKVDGIDNPLEKLLSICRSWFLAASQHKELWSSFRIDITSNKILRFWCSRIAKRLERSGEDTPLDVDVVTYQIFKTEIIDEALLFKISSLIIGGGDCICKRWRRLSIVHTHPLRSIDGNWNQALCNPTPNLRFLRIYGLYFEKPILPFAPFLEEIDLFNSDFQVIHACEQLKAIRLRGEGVKIRNIDTMILPTNLTTLEVVYYRELWRIPTHFPALQTASFIGPLDNSVIYKFSMPQLRSLSLFPNSNDGLIAFINCPGIDFQQLETIGLGIHQKKRAARGVIEKVINSAPLVKRIRTLTQSIAEIVLEALEEGRIRPSSLAQGCEVELKCYNRDGRLVEGTFGIHSSTKKLDILGIRMFCRQNGLGGRQLRR